MILVQHNYIKHKCPVSFDIHQDIFSFQGADKILWDLGFTQKSGEFLKLSVFEHIDLDKVAEVRINLFMNFLVMSLHL